MELYLIRYSSGKDDTLGLLYANNINNMLAYTLEDEYRDINKKVMHETRIPGGRFPIRFRTEGGFHYKYLEKYGSEFHKGMLEICNVPNFQYVLIHSGNHEGHTSGCVLVGNTSTHNIGQKGFIGSSVDAYKRVYPVIADALLAGEEVFLNIKDISL